MSETHGTTLVRWPAEGPCDEALSALLAAYHLRTESEKGAPVAGVEALPARYRAEVEAPRTAFARDTVLVAVSSGTAAGCVVVTAPEDGRSEVKRLWTDPAFRGRGIASALLGAAFTRSAADGAAAVRLSVWSWRTGAIALYGRLGFAVSESWDERDELVCMERPL
ncbi:GNAT family N-acetyltransferase [Streptomyces sp. NRRL F-5123]|uniref:GNAT family N-acetyltransferase n=1 Tax=Streptomyces sp. NRRL F-5123 TaxID=1463856 RepID=UPI0004E19A5C|nr:GNAT family N-acetyltransferase [Streptomyces sp. NRRL F-5123]